MRLRGWAAYGLAVLVLLALVGAIAVAQSGGGYDLSWNTIDGGGQTFSVAGSYALGGTIGQPDAGVLSGGNYSLSGGFWAGATAGGGGGPVRHKIYLPLLVRN